MTEVVLPPFERYLADGVRRTPAYVETIRSSAEALLQLINDILDFSKIEASQMNLESVEFDPGMIAFEVCELIIPNVKDKPLEVL